MRDVSSKYLPRRHKLQQSEREEGNDARGEGDCVRASSREMIACHGCQWVFWCTTRYYSMGITLKLRVCFLLFVSQFYVELYRHSDAQR